ncbi:MAG: type II toxin-antitoxin system RelE/ParE family toxin [Ferruginibacter sp.]
MYKLIIEKSAKKYIAKQSAPTIRRLIKAIDDIAADPTIGKPLTNHSAQYKYRVGGYRILYDINKKEVTVVIVKVGPRGDIYN